MIDCKALANKEKSTLKKIIGEMEFKPSILIIQVGDSYSAEKYIKGQINDYEYMGIMYQYLKYPRYIVEEKLINDIEINLPNYDAIIIDSNLPDHIDINNILKIIPASKDVDSITDSSIYLPCTPMGIMKILNSYNLEGKNAVIIGRSNTVGKPLINLLLDKDCTVTTCHSKTTDTKQHTKLADFIIVAVGEGGYLKPDYIGMNHPIVVDVGINYSPHGIVGDVNEMCCEIAEVTPVPNGVGQLTRVSLIENIIRAHELNN